MKALLLLALTGTLSTTSAPQTLTALGGGAPPQPSRLSESVVLIIDAQREYTAGRLPLTGVDDALHQTARLLARARAAGAPVIHIQQVSKPGRGLFDPQDSFVAFAPEATPAVGETVITKLLPNAFAGTTLDRALQQTGRKNIIISGYMTHMCVSSTARAALDLGYKAVVAADASATRDLPDPMGGVIAADALHRAALAELADRFAIVAKVDDIPGK